MISDEVEERMQTTNFMRDTVRGVRLKVMGEEMAKDAKTRIQYAAKYASSANYWKNAERGTCPSESTRQEEGTAGSLAGLRQGNR